MTRLRLWPLLERLSTVAVLGVAVLILWRELGPGGPTEFEVPSFPISLDEAPIAGDATAAVGMVVFSDFECRYCGSFARETWPKLREEYVDTHRVLVAFRHFPLEDVHRQAFRAAEAAECGARQGKFWPVHDQLFAIPGSPGGASVQNLEEAAITAHVVAAGLDTQQFRNCLASGVEKRIRADIKSATQLGVRSTPSFLIGRLVPGGKLQASRAIRGARPIEEFWRALDEALSGGSR